MIYCNIHFYIAKTKQKKRRKRIFSAFFPHSAYCPIPGGFHRRHRKTRPAKKGNAEGAPEGLSVLRMTGLPIRVLQELPDVFYPVLSVSQQVILMRCERVGPELLFTPQAAVDTVDFPPADFFILFPV